MSNIKINAFPTRKQYTYAGGDPIFVLDFPFFENEDIFVYVSNPAENGTQEDPLNLVTEGADYTVAGAGLAYGGTVTFTPAYNLTVGYTVTVVGRMAIDRFSILETTSAITRAQYNEDMNRLTCMIQQLNTIVEQTMPKYDRSEFINTDRTLPNTPFSYVNLPWLPAGYTWCGNAAETGLTIFQLAAGGGVGFVTAEHPDMRPSIALWTGTDFVLTDSAINITDNNFIPLTPGDTIGVDNTAAAWGLPAHGTADRPAVPDDGDIYYDTDLNGLYAYYAGAWHLLATGAESSVVQDTITQANTFLPGNIVRRNKDTNLYVLARGNSQEESEVCGIVTAATLTQFTIQFIGKVTIVGAPGDGWIDGRVMFLDPTTPGVLRLTEPTVNGQVSKPLLICTSATTGIFFNWRGIVLTDAADINQGTEVIIVTVPQVNHGFEEGDALYTDTPDHYALAFNDGTYHQADVIGLVREVIDADHFTLQMIGYSDVLPLGMLPGPADLVPNTSYFLHNQANAGKLTSVEPVSIGSYSRLVLTTTNTTKGWIKETKPTIVEANGGGAGPVIIDSHVINNDTSVEFSNVFDGTYQNIQIVGTDLIFSANTWIAIQIEAGGVWDTTAQYRVDAFTAALPGSMHGGYLNPFSGGLPISIKGNNSAPFNDYNKTSFSITSLGIYTTPKQHLLNTYLEFVPSGASYGTLTSYETQILWPTSPQLLASTLITGIRFIAFNVSGVVTMVSGTITIYGTAITP